MLSRGAALAALVLTAFPLLSIGAQPRGGDGYLFRRPHSSLSLRLGAAQPDASSELFSFVSRQLTVDRGDFLGLSGMADFSVALTGPLELQLAGGFTNRRIGSEYRDFVDNNDQPIEQRTHFRRVPLTAGLKFNLRPAGRTVSRYAWVPTRFVPYVAAGGGVMHYRFKQTGDFVDFRTNDVFSESLRSSGWTGALYAAAGATWSLNPTVGLISEVRYDRARATLGRDFEGFDPIALSGVGLTAGLLFRF